MSCDYKPPNVRDHLTPEGQRLYDEHQLRMATNDTCERLKEASRHWREEDETSECACQSSAKDSPAS